MVATMFRNLRNPDVAVDLGTAMARASTDDFGSFVEVPANTGPRAALRHGAVVDPSAAAAVLEPLFHRFARRGLRRSRALACAPSDITESERSALISAVLAAGASEVAIVSETLAAAIGAGASVADELPCMVIDIGEGVTDCAVITEGQIIASLAVRGGCGSVRESATQLLRAQGLPIDPHQMELLMRVVGLDGEVPDGTRLPFTDAIDVRLVQTALRDAARPIVVAIAEFVGTLEPYILTSVFDSSVKLTGGGALLPGMASTLSRAMGLPVSIPHDPRHAVILGVSAMLDVARKAGMWHSN